MPNSSTVILIILNSDFIYLDKLGHQKVHPIYITIRNISKKIHQKSNQHAIMLLSYLLILDPKLHEKNKYIFKKVKSQTFHYAITIILEQLIPIAKTGMIILKPDGKVYKCYLILVSYAMDYPKAYMIYQIKQRLCVHCNISKEYLYDLITT